MMIPANSANPQGAYQLMDYVYQPEIAQLITEWVAYMSPVPAVQDLIAQHATEESGEYAADLADMAENPLLWPDDASSRRPRSVATSRPTRNARSGTTSSSRSRRRAAPGSSEGSRAPDRGRRRPVRRRAAEACRPIPCEATEPGRVRDPRTRRHLPDARLHRAADPRGLHLAAERGLLSGGYQFTWAFENYADAFSSSKTSSLEPCCTRPSRPCSRSCSPTLWRTGSPSTPAGGSRRSSS